jgi:ABC-type lipoprotein export system ATPase subunit
MFDVPPKAEQQITWHGRVPLEERQWNVGLIVGPSGCGKTTVARALFGNALTTTHEWRSSSVLDDFPPHVSIEELAAVCQAVGFNTIPAWLRPYGVLSNGERFRVDLARTLIEHPQLSVVDEFTSVVDRQVAQIGSHAVQKHVRRNGAQFVAISCHYDIAEWLQPDWVLEPATMTFTWRSVQRRPAITGDIARVEYAAWHLFAPFHYLTAELNRAAQCFMLFVEGRPAAFAGVLYRPHPRVRNIFGVSRLVTLPDFQGLGLAFVLSDTLGAAFKALGQRLHTYPAHPSLIRGFDKSPHWHLQKMPGRFSARSRSIDKQGGRPCAVFEYTGSAAPSATEANELLNIAALRKISTNRDKTGHA